jgi:hypothetical protein
MAKVVNHLPIPRSVSFPVQKTSVNKEFIVKALKEKAQGLSQAYKLLIQEFECSIAHVESQLCNFLRTLTECVPYFHEDYHEDLVAAILSKFEYTVKNDDAMNSLINFIFHLVSAHNYFVSVIFRSLVKQMYPKLKIQNQFDSKIDEK